MIYNIFIFWAICSLIVLILTKKSKIAEFKKRAEMEGFYDVFSEGFMNKFTVFLVIVLSPILLINKVLKSLGFKRGL